MVATSKRSLVVMSIRRGRSVDVPADDDVATGWAGRGGGAAQPTALAVRIVTSSRVIRIPSLRWDSISRTYSRASNVGRTAEPAMTETTTLPSSHVSLPSEALDAYWMPFTAN